MLADTPNIDDPTGGGPSLSKGDLPGEGSVGLPVRRMGLEQEFFLVDRSGEPRDLADLFLWKCREAARAEGLDPRCFKAESSKSLVEIVTPPGHDVEDLAKHYLAFSSLNGELLSAAVTRGVQDPRVEAYLDSIVRFASPYLERPELVEPLGSPGGYKTTEVEVLESFPPPRVSLTREEGLSLVREACLRLKEQVSSLGQRYGATLPGDERDPKAARVIHIRNSPTIPAEGASPASLHDAKASARAAN